ncbi:hypothetical protein VSS74_17860 [Conexibacter stalactiti]|uniref:Glycosyltransferase n=1 Tax=Conexibacter stalactiti TaxID=1940611 RepID=A0ABU4HTV1_9ACTN|nr:hypothetical protein [Conexibacter stalactiti]MDW5596219.1 hypothetical protein [Conexibacter stalactiti]MEC5036861.1 hypothetical protein [Conexibacter stalactiti]
MRIAAFTSHRFGSSYYRVYDPLQELLRRGHSVQLTTETVDVTDDVLAADVVFLHRYQDAPTQKILRQLRTAGVPIVWDHDDNVANAPERRRGGLRSQEVAAGLRAMVGLADVITTTNELLAAQYREAGARQVCVVPNFLPRGFDEVRPSTRPGELRIGWIAWADHKRDWQALRLREVFRELLEERPEVVVENVGPFDLGLGHERYEHTREVEFPLLAGRIARFDVGIAPLADSPFNRGRSDIKLKEYAAFGIPWLASPIGPYVGLGEREGGLLVADDEWPAALRRIVTDAKLRKKLSKRGEKWARGHRLAGNADVWEAAFRSAIAAPR